MPTSKSIYPTRVRALLLGHWGTLLALLLISGCMGTVPPVQEMSDARQAVAAAREAGAEQHAPQTFDRALSLLGNAEATLERRRYRQARDQALASRRLAIEAMEQAQARGQVNSP